MSVPVVSLRDLRFAWPGGAPCLQIDELEIGAAEALFLQGPSGCGKSTLLSLIAGMMTPSAGRAMLLGQDWAALRPSRRDAARVDHIGIIFQQFNLLPYLSVLDNVLLPCRFSERRAARAGQGAAAVQAAAEVLLEGVGLGRDIWRRAASDLSVGQQQRVAAARALIGLPELVLADEPTSALDEARRNSFVELLMDACQRSGAALLFVSHDERIASRFQRHLALPVLNRVAAAA